MDVSGKVAIVTGSAPGLGKAYAEALLQRAAKVVLCDIQEDLGIVTEKEFKLSHGDENVVFVKGDVCSQKDMEGMFDVATRRFGGVDIVINNAGIGASHSFERTLEVNLFGTIRCCELALKHMQPENGGSGGVVVNIGSVAGIYTLPSSGTYPTSKHAVVGYSGCLGKRMLSDCPSIRVVTLCPGCVKTELTRSAWEHELETGPTDALLHFGGWMDMSVVVDACMRIIETDVPSGSVVKADPSGINIVLTDDVPLRPL